MSPAQYSLTVQNRGLKHQSFHFITQDKSRNKLRLKSLAVDDVTKVIDFIEENAQLIEAGGKITVTEKVPASIKQALEEKFNIK